MTMGNTQKDRYLELLHQNRAADEKRLKNEERWKTYKVHPQYFPLLNEAAHYAETEREKARLSHHYRQSILANQLLDALLDIHMDDFLNMAYSEEAISAIIKERLDKLDQDLKKEYQIEEWDYLNVKFYNRKKRDKIAKKLKKIANHSERRVKHAEQKIPVKAELRYLREYARHQLKLQLESILASRKLRSYVANEIMKHPRVKRHARPGCTKRYGAIYIPRKKTENHPDIIRWAKLTGRTRES